MTAVDVRCMRSFLSVVCLGAALGLFGTAIPAEADDRSASSLTANLGSIDFPNSGATEAQTAFLTSMKALHSFEFEDAGEAFREAQAIDPDFGLAYWGEALSYNHPLWSEQDRDAAHAALARYAPTPQDRANKTPSGREKGLMEAVDVLYGYGDKLSRDIAYSEAMRHLHEAFPEDDEIATLYALSLLGTVRRGDKGFGRQVRAGAIAMAVFARNPKHPGAAHFIIHAFDDPEHAILALANIRNSRKRFGGNASTAYRARIIAVEQKELESALALAQGDDDAAEDFLVEATALEAELNTPSGPPLPMKPAHEMYGEFLLARGRMEEAAVQFNKALERTPNRIRSVPGLERAREHSSDINLLQ